MPQTRPATQTANTIHEEWPQQAAADLVQFVDMLRSAAQQIERQAPEERRPVMLDTMLGGIYLSPRQARAMLRAIAPLALCLNHRNKLTHATLNGALSQFVAALISAGRRAPQITADSIAAAIGLQDALGEWIAAARWQQATTAAGVAWAQAPRQTRPRNVSIRDITRQSTAIPAEQPKNKQAAPPVAQPGLLLPIPGGKQQSQPATKAPPNARSLARTTASGG